MQALDKDLRGALEKTVKAARETAEIAAFAALDQLGVGHDKPEAFLSDAEKALRNRLRTHGKQLGDARDSKSTNPTYGKQEVQHLVQEVAYQHWHRMLFARFLADNDLLMYDGVAVTIEECDELAADEGAKNGWELAGKLAARMLPQVFKPGSPVFELTFAPEHQSELERLLKTLPDAVFKASDSLGWVYQFWQADNKERINKSEVKIGADELPAVTQLFTEPYMVAFLLHNSLGAWWVTRRPETPCPVDLTYLRFAPSGDGSNAVPPAPTFAGQVPAAGKFEGWPDSLAELKLLDPCCGSGHFLVAAFLMLVPMRMVAEGLSAKEAVNRVLAENIHGLELDPRCVEIAVFAVALEAWRFPDTAGKPLGVREIPAPNIACCGLQVGAKAEEWEALVPDTHRNASQLRTGLSQLHDTFSLAPLLGSLLDPRKSHKGDLFEADYEALKDLLNEALARESLKAESTWDIALAAQGLLEAARILEDSYHLVITNVPYLGRGQHSEQLKSFCDLNYSNAKGDLANVFLQRCIALAKENGAGVIQIVMPQNWLFLGSYSKQRRELLQAVEWNFLARLGERGFESTQAAGAFVILLTQTNSIPKANSQICGIDASAGAVAEKSEMLRSGQVVGVSQSNQLSNPDSRILLVELKQHAEALGKYADSYQGIVTGDKNRFCCQFWEVNFGKDWDPLQTSSEDENEYSGLSLAVLWQEGKGDLHRYAAETRDQLHDMHESGNRAWGRFGVAINRMRNLRGVPYFGDKFENNLAVLVPKREEYLPALIAYCSSSQFASDVREIDMKVSLTNATLVKVGFDYEHWKQVAIDSFHGATPKPLSNAPTQWIFHGHPQPSTDPLQVAVARLVGYTWPAEVDAKMELSDEARAWIARSKVLSSHADNDGIVCIPPVGQESSASDRLLNLLANAYGDAWSTDTLAQLLTVADHAGKSLETWLRDKFFTQHCALFSNRPFVWHVWDGLRDGFSALVNYHKLDYKTLEALIYTYLGDWIGRQKRDADNGVDGAQEKLAAADVLKKRLELILAGEAPYDIFVRWKPIEEQPIGWNPDLNDGVRLNIRPFLSVPDVGKRGAGVLRDKPKSLHWEKDRGSDVPTAPWYELGLQYDGKVGDRINDHHLSLAEKRAAREKAK
jgi:hypothetical protein